ncbi:class I SAM-dependent methyltransferase [Candidatus Daviesbacteria bacterium]|nr:class I SAM-dependent methyltransferase [Candidatus Daviesbacteria bacterium]
MNTSQLTSVYRTKLIISVYKKWIKKGNSILDIGCGTGVVTKILGDYYPSKVTGADIKNYLIYKVPFIKIENGKIPVKNNSFDFSLLNDVLHHVDKEYQKNVLKEAARVGKKVLLFEFEPTILGKLADVILNKFHYGNLHVPLSMRTKYEWQDLIKSLGFKSKVIVLKKPFWYPFSHMAFIISTDNHKS